MIMVALVLAGIFTVSVIQHQRQAMERLVRARQEQPRKRGQSR